MPAATNSITQFKGEFIYSNGTPPEVYPKWSNKSVQVSETLQEFSDNIGISENLRSDIAP